MEKDKKAEVLLWSIAFPGFRQVLNKRYFKAFTLIALAFLINVRGSINIVIMNSFLGRIEEAIGQTDLQ